MAAMIKLRRPDQTTTDPRLDLLWESTGAATVAVGDLPKAPTKPDSYPAWTILEQTGPGSASAAIATALIAFNPLYAESTRANFKTGPMVLENAAKWQAQGQQLDPWANDSDAIGGSLPSTVNAVVVNGWFAQTAYTRSARDVIDAIHQIGPVVLGLPWHEQMIEPSPSNIIHPKGELVGAHAITAVEVSGNKKELLVRNSWGAQWGVEGHARLKIVDLERIFDAEPQASALILTPPSKWSV